jgi:isopropylmalate/homocitrate/citramalate synthase
LRVLVGGKYSGPYTIKAKAEELGLKLSDEQVGRVLEKVRAKILGKKTSMTDEEFLEMAKKV